MGADESINQGEPMAAQEKGATLIVRDAGALALVQDGGRFGVRHLGVTQGGAVDWVSLGWANWLLGNAVDAAGIEITLGGFVVEVQTSTTLALAGGELGATLDGEPVPPHTRFRVDAGQTLAFGQATSGLRAYLALPGGVAATPFMGSTSSVIRECLGGLDGEGRALAVDDVIVAAGREPAGEARVIETPPRFTEETVDLEMVPGAQIAQFDGASVFATFNERWEVDARADRMGVRLIGQALRNGAGGMISEGIPLGAVQVPPDGQPIVLLNDRQTVGGYPRLGALTPLACARLGQCPPGTQLRLVPVSPHRTRRQMQAQFARWR
ncbi:biotin-dependent carboxyltransferase family protein [Salinicola halophilus]|uniref:5-oxoprolinase subunit C family protein n=1 Tax=Salinicola halophilus TaxID=184065 RepID=UPI001EF93228|nr:biotin-dependent carboxyltransferase family protein [Salinicola halophilus]